MWKVKIGYASVDITPDLGVELSGYGWFLGRKAEGVLDKLYARAVAFKGNSENDAGGYSGNNAGSNTKIDTTENSTYNNIFGNIVNNTKSMLLINCDLVALKQSITNIVKQQISSELGIDEKNIMIVCTHTHTGPATGKLIGCGEPDDKYLASLPKLLVSVGKMAFRSLKEVKEVKSVVELINPIGFNRVFGSDGPVDSNVQGIAFYFDDGRPLALVSYGCHPVTIGPAKDISADYPGKVVKALDNEGFDGVFLTGFCGDIDPVSNLEKWGSGTWKTIDEYGRRIADGFINGISKCKPMNNLNLDAFNIGITLKLQRYNNEDIVELVETLGNEKEENPGIYRAALIWAEEMRRQLEENVNPYFESLTIQIFRIGDVVFAGFPGEIFTALGTIIKEAMPHMNIITLGSTNSTMRYISTQDDIQNKGYAGFLSCVLYHRLPLELGEGEQMAKAAAETIKSRL